MMCLGWKSPDKCGRVDQVVPAGAAGVPSCPDITWFWLAAAATAALAYMTKKKGRTT